MLGPTSRVFCSHHLFLISCRKLPLASVLFLLLFPLSNAAALGLLCSCLSLEKREEVSEQAVEFLACLLSHSVALVEVGCLSPDAEETSV